MLTIPIETACFIAVKAREFAAKVLPAELDTGENPADAGEVESLEAHADDPTYDELIETLEALNDDQLCELLALAWIGRGDYSADEWNDILVEARDRAEARRPERLAAMPLLGEYVENALSQLGYSCEEVEAQRL